MVHEGLRRWFTADEFMSRSIMNVIWFLNITEHDFATISTPAVQIAELEGADWTNC